MRMLLAGLLLSMTVVAAEKKVNAPGNTSLPRVDKAAVEARIDARLHTLLQLQLNKVSVASAPTAR